MYACMFTKTSYLSIASLINTTIISLGANTSAISIFIVNKFVCQLSIAIYPIAIVIHMHAHSYTYTHTRAPL